MNSDPISKKQVYTDRYGEVPAQNQPQGDYDSFDVNGVQDSQRSLSINPDAYGDMASGARGEGLGDEDLFSGMSEEEYVAHYQNRVAPQNRQEAEALMAEMGEQGEAIFNPRKAIQNLKDELNKSENKLVLDEEATEHFKDKIRELERLVGKPGTNRDELQDRIEGVKDELSGAIEEAKGTLQEKISSMKQMSEDLIKKIDKAGNKMTAEKKEELREQLETLKSDLKKPNVDVKKCSEKLEEINEAMGKDKKLVELKKKFTGLSGKVPGKGHRWETTTALAELVTTAISNNNWTEVDTFLRGLHENDANNVVQQFVGTLYYGVADKNDEKLNQLLSFIPLSIRETMSRVALTNVGEQYSGENLDKKEEFMYFGTPRATSTRLLNGDIEESPDDIELDVETSSDN